MNPCPRSSLLDTEPGTPEPPTRMLARRSLWAWAAEARGRRVALNIKGRLARAECFGARAVARGCLEGWQGRCREVKNRIQPPRPRMTLNPHPPRVFELENVEDPRCDSRFR